MSIADAQHDFSSVLPRVVDISPMFAPGVTTEMLLQQAQPRPLLTPMRDDVVGGIAGTLWIVAATAGLLLIVACANVANLVLVRADGRQRELAVRAAIGAGRSRVLTYFLAEAAVLATIAAVLGLAIAATGIRLLVTAGPVELPRLAEVRMDGSVVAFTFVITALIALACSMIPALRFARVDLIASLREGGRGGTSGRARQRVRGTLVAAQIALALVVLAGSGLLIRTFRELQAVKPGWNADGVATFWLSPPESRYPGDSALTRFYARLAQRVAALPGVRTVGLTSQIPFEDHGRSTSPIWVEGDPSAASQIPPVQAMIAADSGYFGAMGIPLLAGRTFLPLDARQGITLTIAGVVAGLALFALVARFIRSLLFGAVPSDPVTLVAASLLLIIIAALASWIPARRAARVDPMVALRAE